VSLEWKLKEKKVIEKEKNSVVLSAEKYMAAALQIHLVLPY
jgi:hypothetical protein